MGFFLCDFKNIFQVLYNEHTFPILEVNFKRFYFLRFHLFDSASGAGAEGEG